MATYTSHYNLTKPEGTERVNIAIINQNMDSIDTQMYKNAQSIIANHGGMAIPSNNNTHAAVSSGQYVYVYNHSSLAEGLYVAKSAISTNGALSLSNLTAVSNGGLNHVYSTLNSKFTWRSETPSTFDSTKLTDVVAMRRGYTVLVRVTIKAGLATDWHNDIVTGLSNVYTPPTAVYGIMRVNSVSDINKRAIAVMNTNGNVQFLPGETFNADVPFEFIFPTANNN